MDDFREVSAIRLTFPRTPYDLRDLARFFHLLDAAYEDCVTLTTLDRVSMEVQSERQQKLLGSLDDVPGLFRPRVKRLAGGSLLIELGRNNVWEQGGSVFAVFFLALKGVERVATMPKRIRSLNAKQECLRAEEDAKRASVEADRAEADARRARAEDGATAVQHYDEVAARMAEDTLVSLTATLTRLYALTGGKPEVEEIPDAPKVGEDGRGGDKPRQVEEGATVERTEWA
ncbi:hypothetical protein [Streptomyces sp. NPDC001076]